jgi:hypothetical protein
MIERVNMATTTFTIFAYRVGSVCVTLAVNFERFHAIVFPLKHFGWKKYLLPTCVVFAVVYNLPKYFEMTIENDGNFTELSTTGRSSD